MRRISHFIVLAFFIFLFSCTPDQPLQTFIVVYRFEPPAFLEYNEAFELTRERPFSVPPNCGLFGTFPTPSGPFLVVELSCPNGQTVLFLDLNTGSTTQPFPNTDSHFLAWQSDGSAAYFKLDSLGNPQIVRAGPGGRQEFLPVTGFTYDLSPAPGSKDFIFTFSRGLGYGSELHLTHSDGLTTQLLYSDGFNYISYARFSPDGKQVAFIKTPDTSTPFTVGELWVIPSTSSGQRPSTVDFANGASPSAQGGKSLADADAGHGYAANWSPDGTKIAFVVRENPEDENADTSSDALISNIYVVDVESGTVTRITDLVEGRAETPFWSPDGNTLTFTVVINGRMTVSMADAGTGEIRSLVTESACCPAWMRK